MDHEFMELLLDQTHFPQEARQELHRCVCLLEQAGQDEALEEAVAFFYRNQFDVKVTEPLLQAIGQATGIPLYTVWLLLLIQASVPAKSLYRRKGIGEEIFWNTFSDLTYKLYECKNVQGVWGNFVPHWYSIFFTGDIVKLGRLEYENSTYDWDQPYQGCGITLQKGTPVKNIHIPSSGEPFTLDARLDSYRQAYEFFREELQGGPLVCVCGSWLLYPPYRDILPSTSHVVDFMGDFQILGGEAEEVFHDAWRVFGADAQKPFPQLPEKTSMQRAFKQYLLSGKKTGEGFGVLVFDGERLLTR